MKRVDLVSGSDAPVLLLGETGTGKEVVARAIHTRSDRRDGPFIRVNCGAIPPELVDSQLFGHEKGSFTGAGETRKGWFERADGGTLFLDEIGELPPDAQVRFLRVLQDSFVERVGGHEPIARRRARRRGDASRSVGDGPRRPVSRGPVVSHRRVSRSCCRRCANGSATFRSWPRTSPSGPRVKFGLSPVDAQPRKTCKRLRTYSWPGNIRELGAVIDRAAILGEGHGLEIVAALGFGGDAPGRSPAAHALNGDRQAPRRSPMPSCRSMKRSSRTSSPAYARRGAASKANAARRRCWRSIRTRCERGCGSWASTGRHSATTNRS